MDIAFVSNVVFPFVKGGAQKRIHEIGTRLVDRGHNVTVYARKYWDGPPEQDHEGLTLKAVAGEKDLYVGDRRSIYEAIEYAAAVTPTLAKRSSSHDLIVVSVFPYFPVLSAAVVSTVQATPMVTTWHEVWGDYWDSYLGRLAPFGKLIERITAEVPQHPVAVSEVTATKLADLGIDRLDVDVVPNGIDVEHVQSVPPVSSGYDVLFVGRLIPEKNVEILIGAFEKVVTNYDATLGIIGDGPQAESLREKAVNSRASDRIEFLGTIEDHDEILGQMKAGNVFAAPSVREGFGITYLEAMAAGCTVIGADHPNSAASEVIGDAGYVSKPNAESVADALVTALEQGAPGNPVATAQQYDWSVVTDEAERVYRQAIADGEGTTSAVQKIRSSAFERQ